MPTPPVTTAYQQLQQWDQQVAIMQESNRPLLLFGSAGEGGEATGDIGQEQPAGTGSGSVDLYA